MKRTLSGIFAVGLLALLAGPVLAQTSTHAGSLRAPSTSGASGECAVYQDNNGTIKGEPCAVADSAVSITVYSQTVTPTVVTANRCEDQAVTVTGLTTSDKIFVNSAPVSTAATQSNVSAFVTARVSGADVAAFRYCNVSAGNSTPAGGTFNIIAVRS